MASNIERLGGYIKDKAISGAENFAFGAKAAFYSGNPAMFGAIESGISNLKKSFDQSKENESNQSRREQAEQRRQRGFQEEQAREQRYNELQQQKIFESMDENIKKILEVLGGKPDKGIGFKFPATLLTGAAVGATGGAAAVASRAVKAIQSIPRPAWLDELKLASIFPKNLPERFPTSMIRNMLPGSRGGRKLPPAGFFKDLNLKGLKGGDDLNFLAKFMKQMDAIFDSIRPSLTAIKEFFGPELKLLKGLGPKILKVLPGVGLFVMAIEGLMNAFDTENLQNIFGEQKVGFSERVGGFVAGFLGSFVGLLDLVLMLFGIEIEESIQSQFTNWATEWMGNFLRFFQDIFLSVGATAEVIYGTLSGDKERYETGMDKLTYLNKKYLDYFRNFVSFRNNKI
jgi:hypothetical protein